MAWNVKADRGQFPATPLFGMVAPPPPADEEGLRELSGVCVRQMLVASAAEFDAAVRRPWLESGVVVLRDQPADLTPRELVEFSRRLGDLDVRPHDPPTAAPRGRFLNHRLQIHVAEQFLLPEHREILQISNRRHPDGRPMGFEQAGRYWHSVSRPRNRPHPTSCCCCCCCCCCSH